MDAGRMDRRIRLLKPETTQDSTGFETTDWIPVAEVWAAYTPVRGGEQFAAQQRFAEATARFKIRPYPGIGAEWRVEYDGRHYDLVDVQEIGRGEGLMLVGAARAD